jgi:hypothetical protein
LDLSDGTVALVLHLSPVPVSRRCLGLALGTFPVALFFQEPQFELVTDDMVREGTCNWACLSLSKASPYL